MWYHCQVSCVCFLSRSRGNCSFGVLILGHALPSLQVESSCFSGRSSMCSLYKCIVCTWIYESVLWHVSVMTRIFWLAWFKKIARLIYHVLNSCMPGFIPSLHLFYCCRSLLTSQCDDSLVLLFVGCWMWDNLAVERKLCFGCMLGSCNNLFHFAIVIKVKLQSRWEFCL